MVNTADSLAEITATPIAIPYPQNDDLHLSIAVGACRLRIVPGNGPDWVTGTYHDPSAVLPLEITHEGGSVRIGQRQNIASMLRIFNTIPTLELVLGKPHPYTLLLESGASESHIDLGGLPLTGLEIKQGAGKVTLDFSAHNPIEMSTFRLTSGASGLELRNLANAGFAEMHIEGGAASYKLDFGGALKRNAYVVVSAAMSSVEIWIPAHTAAHITSQAMMGGVEAGQGYTRSDGELRNRAALDGHTPALTIQTNITMGSLHLHAT